MNLRDPDREIIVFMMKLPRDCLAGSKPLTQHFFIQSGLGHCSVHPRFYSNQTYYPSVTVNPDSQAINNVGGGLR
jgi:hypothetical protein